MRMDDKEKVQRKQNTRSSSCAKNDTNLRASTNLCFLLSLSLSLSLRLLVFLVFSRGQTAKHPSVKLVSSPVDDC